MVLLGSHVWVSCVYLGCCRFAVSVPQPTDCLEIYVFIVNDLLCVEWDISFSFHECFFRHRIQPDDCIVICRIEPDKILGTSLQSLGRYALLTQALLHH